MTKKNEMIETQELATVQVSQTMPDFLRGQRGGRGSEAVGQNDLTIPRIEVVQSLSKVRKKTSPEYIEGAEEGMLYNSVTREVYGSGAKVVPVYFLKECLLWREQSLGGGFGGAYGSDGEAEAARQAMEKPEEWESVLTHQHFCLILKDDGSIEDAVISMAKSKLKVSKKFNSLVRLNGGDRFSRVYCVRGVQTTNAQNKEFYTLDMNCLGFVSEPVYRRAEKVYSLVASGAVTADRGSGGMSDEDVAPSDEY